MTIADYTAFTGHDKPTREVAHSIVHLWATDYFLAQREASNLEDFDQYVRRLSVELHATVRERHFDDVLNAVTEVYEVVDEESEELRMNQLGTIDNKAELLDAKQDELAACINHLLNHAGFGLSPRSVAA